MFGFLDPTLERLRGAARVFFEQATGADIPLLVAGAVIYLGAQAVRTRGWHTILRTTYPEASTLRARDTAAAYLAGAGLNAIIPARGGDVVKLALVKRRIPDGRYAALIGTFIPETVFETLFGTALVVWALVHGFLPVPTSGHDLDAIDVSFVLAHPFVSAGLAVAILVLGTLALGWIRRKGADLIARFREGLAIFATPRTFVTGVASWQALGRLIRLGSLACFMQAFDLPVTFNTVVLVMAAQGGGRIIPLAPVSTGLRLVMLFYGFVEVTGHEVSPGAISAFTFGMGAILLVAGLLTSAVILLHELGTLHPRTALRRARESFDVPVPA